MSTLEDTDKAHRATCARLRDARAAYRAVKGDASLSLEQDAYAAAFSAESDALKVWEDAFRAEGGDQ